MKPAPERLARKFELFVEIRERAVGDRLVVPAASQWTTGTFEALVTALYKLLCEAWDAEIQFIGSAAVMHGPDAGDLRRFSQQLRTFRQSHQHDDNPRADQDLRSWLRSVDAQTSDDDHNSKVACAALVEQAIHAMGALVGLAKNLESDVRRVIRWRQFASDTKSYDPEEQLAIVAGDLGLSLPRKPDHLIRTAGKGWAIRSRSLSAADDRISVMEHVVTQVLVGQYMDPLPCSYNDVLEALEIEPGSSRSFGAVVAAHGFARLISYDDADEFLHQLVAVFEQLAYSG